MIFNSFAHPCVVIDVLTDVWVGGIIKVLVDGEFSISMWVDVVIDPLSDVIIDIVSDIDVEMLTDVSVKVLIASVTAL